MLLYFKKPLVVASQWLFDKERDISFATTSLLLHFTPFAFVRSTVKEPQALLN